MKSVIRSLFFPTAVYYAATLLAPNKLSFVILTVAYAFTVWRLTKDFRLSLAAAYLALSPFVMGKTFDIELVSARALAIPWRPFGISADVLVTFQDASVVIMAVYLGILAWNREIRYERNHLLEFFLFLYPAGTIIATYMGSVRPDISFLHALFTLKPMIVFYFFASIRNFSVRRVLGIVSAGLCLEAVMVAGQIFRGGSLGLLIEPIYNYVVVDPSLDAAGLIRYSGTYMHANALANGMLIPLLALVPVMVNRSRQYRNMAYICFFLGFGVFIATMSRSAWISMGMGVSAFIYVSVVLWRYRLSIAHQFGATSRWIVGIFIVLCSVAVVPRITSTRYTNGAYGSVETRMMLLREYGELIKTSPVFGVGLEMDVYTGYMRSLVRGDSKIDSPNRSVLQYFPEPVHNGILRLFVQTGAIVVGIYMGLLGVLWYSALRTIHRARGVWDRLISLSLICMFIATVVNSMMQPILPDLALLIALTSIYTQRRI